MRLKKWATSIIAMAIAVTTVQVMEIAPASASSASGTLYWNSNNSLYWQYNIPSATYGQFRMITDTEGLAYGYCMTGYFDWRTASGGHHDARAARSCRNGSSSFIDTGANSDVGYFTGVQQVVLCYGQDNTLIGGGGSCVRAIGTEAGLTAGVVNFPNPCISAWVRRGSGNAVFFDGGNNLSCTS